MITRYYITDVWESDSATTLRCLAKLVDDLITQGWQLQGGVCTTIISNPCHPEVYWHISQAMVKHD